MGSGEQKNGVLSVLASEYAQSFVQQGLAHSVNPVSIAALALVTVFHAVDVGARKRLKDLSPEDFATECWNAYLRVIEALNPDDGEVECDSLAPTNQQSNQPKG